MNELDFSSTIFSHSQKSSTEWHYGTDLFLQNHHKNPTFYVLTFMRPDYEKAAYRELGSVLLNAFLAEVSNMKYISRD